MTLPAEFLSFLMKARFVPAKLLTVCIKFSQCLASAPHDHKSILSIRVGLSKKQQEDAERSFRNPSNLYYSIGRVIMRRSCFSLLVAVAFVAVCIEFTAADNGVNTQVHQGDDATRSLKTTTDSTDEERAATTSILNRVKTLLRMNPTKAKDAKLDTAGAKDAISKVKGIMGRGQTSTKLTPEKLKTLETYARDNPDKWYAMAYYLNYGFGIGLVAFLLYGTFYLGWRPLGLGGPSYN